MLHLVKPSNIIDVGGGAGIGPAYVRADLDNMVGALARHHGLRTAQDIVAEAFALAFARWALDGGSPIPCRFAMEVALDNAFRLEHARRQAPAGGSAA
jgi:hypothetical protein